VGKLSSKSLLAIAFVFSLVVAVLVYNFLNSVQMGNTNESYTVVVARQEILANTLIDSNMVEQIVVSGKNLQPGAISELNRVVGVYAKETIQVNEQITERRVIDDRATGLSSLIPRDKRALSVAITDVTGVAFLIKPGDYVDVIAVIDAEGKASAGGPVANMIIQNVLVLATDKTIGREDKGALAKDSKMTTVTIAVTPDDAITVGLAASKGTVTLVLRPYASTDVAIAKSSAKTLEDLQGGAQYSASAVSAPSMPTPMLPSMPTPPLATMFEHGGTKGISVIRGTTVQDVHIN